MQINPVSGTDAQAAQQRGQKKRPEQGRQIWRSGDPQTAI